MHQTSVRLSNKHLYIADLVQRLESMESGRMAMNAIAYRLFARRMTEAVAAYLAGLLAAQLGSGWPSVLHAIEQRRFSVGGTTMRDPGHHAAAVMGALLGRLTRPP